MPGRGGDGVSCFNLGLTDGQYCSVTKTSHTCRARGSFVRFRFRPQIPRRVLQVWACKQLAHAGCSGPEIMAVSGHSTLAQVYIDEVEQERMAASAMGKRSAAEAKAATAE
jgi:hypothetical protein